MDGCDTSGSLNLTGQSPGEPSSADRTIAALEGRIRALEYVLSNLPEVTAGVLHAATRDVGLRVPEHPLESGAASHSERAMLADRAIADLWKHKR